MHCKNCNKCTKMAAATIIMRPTLTRDGRALAWAEPQPENHPSVLTLRGVGTISPTCQRNLERRVQSTRGLCSGPLDEHYFEEKTIECWLPSRSQLSA